MKSLQSLDEVSRYSGEILYGPKNLETDRILYSKGGVILSWQVWSDACNAWIPVNMIWFIKNHPRRFADVQDDIFDKISTEEGV